MKINFKTVALVAFLISAVALFLKYRLQILGFAEGELQTNWVLGGVILYILYLGLSVIGIPVAPLTLMSGALIGFEKTMIIMVPSLLSATLLLFALGRTLFKDRIAKTRQEKPHLEVLLKVLEGAPGKWLFYLRISGMTPFALTSYLVSMTRVPIRKLILPSLAGTLPHLTLQSYLGSAGREIAQSGTQQQELKIFLLVLGIAILVAFGFQIKRAYKREAAKVESKEKEILK